jgi:hypothetical protein
MTIKAGKLNVKKGGRGQVLVDGKVCLVRCWIRRLDSICARGQDTALALAALIGDEQEDKQRARAKARARPVSARTCSHTLSS